MRSTKPTIVFWSAAAVVIAVTVYANIISPQIHPKNFAVVEEGSIYRSGGLTSNATTLVHREHNIRTVIDLGGFDKDPVEHEKAVRTAEALGIQRYEFRLFGDATGDPNMYVHALRLMGDESNHPILVHCAAGSERTGACIALYRHIYQGWPLDEALDEADNHGHSDSRNPKLDEMVLRWVDHIKAALETDGSIPEDLWNPPATPTNQAPEDPEPADDAGPVEDTGADPQPE